MDAPEHSRHRRFDLPVAVMLGFLALAACFVAWKWRESADREKCFESLRADSAYFAHAHDRDEWSSEWPFHNVLRLSQIVLHDGSFIDEDVRRLRRTFPGVLVSRFEPERGTFLPISPVQLPED